MLTGFVLWSCAGLVAWWWLLRRMPRETADLVRTVGYRRGDAIMAGALGGWFVWVMWSAGRSDSAPITREMVVMASVFYGMLVLMIGGFMVYRDLNPLVMFGLKPRDWRRVAVVAGVALTATYPVVMLVSELATRWFPEVGGDRTVAFLREGATAGDFLVVGLLALLVAPVAEEVIFRGYLYGVVRRYGGRAAAIVVTSLLFAGIHLNLTGLVPLTLLAIGLALAYELTGSLWTSIAMHMGFNGATLITLLLFPEAAP